MMVEDGATTLPVEAREASTFLCSIMIGGTTGYRGDSRIRQSY
jgi:hypothetical protein